MADSKVYLGNLSYDVRERDIEKFLKGYGRIRSISVKEGFGFVEFEDRRDADDAVKDLDGKTIDGRRVRVEHSRDSRKEGGRFGGGGGGGGGGGYGRGKPPGQRTGYRLVVENLSSSTSWQDLKDYMRQAGDVTYTNTNQSRNGEGIVEFVSKSDMEYALDKLDGSELGGRRIRLYEENKGPRPTRSRSRSSPRRGRGRDSRSRSRSRSKSRDRSKSRSGGRRDRSRSRS